jgi:hypothetical protein
MASDDIMQRMRCAPDVPPADELWSRLLAERARRARRNRAIAGVSASAMALFLMVFIARPSLVGPYEAGMVAMDSQNPPADLQADVRALDRALQAAYNRGASDSEVAPMWETRRALVAKMGM